MDRPPTGRSSASLQPSRISAEEFALVGPSDLPDPAFHAYRKDLADVALAGRVIASHFADPVEHSLAQSAAFRAAPDDAAELLADLVAGERFRLLDCGRGWAWGYGGPDGRVGYVASEALGLS